MSFLPITNFRHLPQSWEMAQPFHINATAAVIGPSAIPGLNWYQPPVWDPTIPYNPNDAVLYGNDGWRALLTNLNTPPGSGVSDDAGNLLLDESGSPIYPWVNLPPLTSSGSVAIETDPVAWARNHILAILLTAPGERVMRPTYGVGVLNYVFESTDPFSEQNLVNQVQMAVSLWEPTITINQCRVVQQEAFSGIFQLQITFSIGSSPTTHTVVFSLGGSGIEVMA